MHGGQEFGGEPLREAVCVQVLDDVGPAVPVGHGDLGQWDTSLAKDAH